MTHIVAMGAAVFPSMLILWFFHSRDIHKEPAKIVWKTFGLGVLSCVPVIMVARLIGPVVDSMGSGSFILAGILNAFFIAAIPEEFFKFQVLSKYSMTREAFDEPMDGMVYGVTVSLGFLNWLKLIFGGLLISGSGIGLLICLYMSFTGSDFNTVVFPAILLIVLLPGLYGGSLFRRGLK